MDDLISRREAIDSLAEWNDAAITNRLNNLPSAQQWTPCSERLPDAGEYYFVTVQYFGWNCTEYRETDIAKYELDGWRSRHNVLAWMSLPEPWFPSY